jgi:hypothetical protein
MIRVIVESPFAGAERLNMRYLRAALLDCFRRNEAPFASHALYPQVLSDADPEERKLGIRAGLLWGTAAEKTVVYYDLGVSGGMDEGIKHADVHKREVEWRTLGAAWDEWRNSPLTVWKRRPPNGNEK